MNHPDHVELLRGGISRPGGVWADFGSGKGAFTLALAELIGSDGVIYSVDKNANALREQEQIMRSRFPNHTVYYLDVDYTKDLDLPPLTGAVFANALHFQRKKDRVVQSIRTTLKPGGRLILVEYNVDRGNPWVPYPLSFDTWKNLASRNGFAETRLLSRRPSSFLGEIYSALSLIDPKEPEF